MVPTFPVLPPRPAPFRNASAGPRVVTGSTIARSPRVGFTTHIPIGRVARFRLSASPVGPCQCRPNPVLRTAVYSRPRDDSRPGMGSKGVLQLPAPRCSRASIFQCTRLQQSAPLARERRTIRFDGIVSRGWRPPTRFSVAGRPTRYWQYTSVSGYSDPPPKAQGRHIAEINGRCTKK